MRKRKLILAAACATAILQGTVMATVTIDGSYDTDYGAGLGFQTNNTQFGDSTIGDGTSGGGSELDGAYAVVQGGALNILLTGNLETNFNHLNLFISDGRPGQSVVSAAGALGAMNGAKFSPGFNATYALDINGGTTTTFVNQYTMPNGGTAPSTFIGQFTPNDHNAHILMHGTAALQFSQNNTNAAGVDGTAPSAAITANAMAVQTGMEISIPLTELGSPSGSIGILADINGGGNGFLSNQFLPGLPSVASNVGTAGGPFSGPVSGAFDFSLVPGMFFSVTVPSTGATHGEWALSGGGSWNTLADWTGGIPHLATDTALFGANATGAANVTLDGSKTVGRITFNNASNSYTISQGTGGTLTIDDRNDPLGESPVISAQAGGHSISAPVALANGVTVDVQNNASLSVSGTISGSGGVLKTGAGTLLLSGSNSFSGTITSQAGTLELDNVNSTAGGTVTLGDPDVDNQPATLALGSTVTTFNTPITTNRDLAANSNIRTVATAANTTIGGIVTIGGGVSFAPASGTTVTVNGVIQNAPDGTSVKHDIHASGSGTVILNSAETATGYLIVDSGTMTMNSSSSMAAGGLIVAASGTLNVNGVLSVAGNPDPVNPLMNTLFALNIGPGGSVSLHNSAAFLNPTVYQAFQIAFAAPSSKLDIGDNELIVSTDRPTVKSQITAGNLITTSTGLSVGYVDESGVVEIRGVFGGDTNLDGVVDTGDFNTLANDFNQTGVFWQDGDFNNDGTVNALDFNILATNFGQTLPSPALGSLVPEPAVVGLLMIPLAMKRRRRA